MPEWKHFAGIRGRISQFKMSFMDHYDMKDLWLGIFDAMTSVSSIEIHGVCSATSRLLHYHIRPTTTVSSGLQRSRS